jgi:hypothetical protein
MIRICSASAAVFRIRCHDLTLLQNGGGTWKGAGWDVQYVRHSLHERKRFFEEKNNLFSCLVRSCFIAMHGIERKLTCHSTIIESNICTLKYYPHAHCFLDYGAD